MQEAAEDPRRHAGRARQRRLSGLPAGRRSRAPAGTAFPRGSRRRGARAAISASALANFVKGTGRGPFEPVTVRIGPSGKVHVYSGAAAMGQGTKTMLAQIVAEQLGGDLANITVTTGDTAAISLGHRRLQQPPGGAGRLVGASRRGEGARQGARGRAPPARSRGRRISRSTAAKSASRARAQTAR